MSGSSSGERSEAATAKRLQTARDAGQVALSREAPTLAVLLGAAAMIMLQLPAGARLLAARLAGTLANAEALDPLASLRAAAAAGVLMAAPFLLVAALLGPLAVLAQTGFLVNLGALRPDLARLSPARGLKRIFSANALLEFGKSVVKLVLAGTVVWWVLRSAMPMLPLALLWDPVMLLDRSTREVLQVMLALVGAQAAIAGFDILRARFRHASDLRMTRQEVKDEHKETEGDPQIKARIRRLRTQRARRRMLQAVAKATVVVTNPTHYAVALSYRRGDAGAPRVVAKGVDVLAQRIREIARAHNVPVVTNPPLARALHQVELDAEIPRELFQAVAEIIAYIWGLRRRAL